MIDTRIFSESKQDLLQKTILIILLFIEEIWNIIIPLFILVSQGMNTVFRSCIIVAFVFLYVVHCNGTRYEVHTAPLSLHSRTPIHVPWVADLISNVTYNKSITELNPNLHMFVNSVLLHIDDGNFQNISEYECIYWVTVYDVRGRNRT